MLVLTNTAELLTATAQRLFITKRNWNIHFGMSESACTSVQDTRGGRRGWRCASTRGLDAQVSRVTGLCRSQPVAAWQVKCQDVRRVNASGKARTNVCACVVYGLIYGLICFSGSRICGIFLWSGGRLHTQQQICLIKSS